MIDNYSLKHLHIFLTPLKVQYYSLFLPNDVVLPQQKLIHHIAQRLFDIYEDGTLIDTTEHGLFMKYFFENGDIIPEKKRILLKRMLMGLTSYYPIDRSSIVYMPQIQKPTISEKRYSEYKIVKNMNIVLCPMSQIQLSNYFFVHNYS